MKNNLYLIPLLLIILGFTLDNPFSQKEFMYSEKSPDGNYEIKVYTIKNVFSAPGDGGTSSRIAYVVLLDKMGNEIGKSGNAPSSYVDIDIDWEIGKNKYVSFARGHGIDLRK